MDELELPPMVVNNEDPKGTAFSVSVDATREHGEDFIVFLPSFAFMVIRHV
jgi:hypothetical protein